MRPRPYNPHEIMLLVTDSILNVDFSLREFENFYVALASTRTLLDPVTELN